MHVTTQQGIIAHIRKIRWQGQRIEWSGYLFLLPFFIPFVIFTVAAIFFGIYVAFTEWGIIGSPTWVGLDNFREAFDDEWVAKAFINTLRYGMIIVPGVVIGGLIFAIFVNQRWPLSGLARTLFFAPNIVSATVIGLVWVWMLDTQFGVVNQYLGRFGTPDIPWLTSTQWSLLGVSLASIWWDLGLGFVLFLSALQEVPNELYDAAFIDGANRLQVIWYITLPMLRPVISMVITLQIIATFRIFSQVYVMTNGGPAGSSMSVIHYIYTTAIVQHRLGYAAAVSLLLFIMILAVTLIQQRIIRERI